MATAILVQFPKSAITRTLKERRVLNDFFKESKKQFPDRTAEMHFKNAVICVDISDLLSKRTAHRAAGTQSVAMEKDHGN